jgi:hypothetical protein
MSSNALQARKAIEQAMAEGRIDESWLIGKRFNTHSPAATNIEVCGCGHGRLSKMGHQCIQLVLF